LLVVGNGPLGQAVAKQMNASISENLLLVGFIDDGYHSDTSVDSLGNLQNLKDLIETHQITDIVIALPYSAYHKMAEIITCLDELPVGVWIALGFFDLALYRTDIEDFAGIPMLDLRASAIHDYQRLIKRAFDLLIVLFALLLALPFMALSALMILLEDGSPILFRQRRVGENGRLFEMLKFRTMIKNAEQLQGQVERWDEPAYGR
jgi:hypothetical protein